MECDISFLFTMTVVSGSAMDGVITQVTDSTAVRSAVPNNNVFDTLKIMILYVVDLDNLCILRLEDRELNVD